MNYNKEKYKMKCLNKYFATMLIIVFWSMKEISTLERTAFLAQLGVKYDDRKQSITIGDKVLNCFECLIEAAKNLDDEDSKLLKSCVKEACKNNLVTQEQENNFMIKTLIEQTR